MPSSYSPKRPHGDPARAKFEDPAPFSVKEILNRDQIDEPSNDGLNE